MSDPRAFATFLLAVDEGGGVLGFSSEDTLDGSVMIRETAASSTVPASVLRVEIPLPPGSGNASVTLLDA
jgi:hypothetical protein